VADVVPLMYGGFLAFFLAVTVFFVRRGAHCCGEATRDARAQSLTRDAPFAARSTSS
jgi:hypothetical protein